MKLTLSLLLVAVLCVAFFLWRGSSKSSKENAEAASSEEITPRSISEAQENSNEEAIEYLLDLLYCDRGLDSLVHILGEDEGAQKVLAHIDAEEFKEAEAAFANLDAENTDSWTGLLLKARLARAQGDDAGAVQAARANLKAAQEGGDSRLILGAWTVLRQMGEQPPADEAGKVLGVVLETGDRDLNSITGAFANGEARLYSLQGMGVIGEMSQYPSVTRRSRACVAEAAKVGELFAPTSERPHPDEGMLRLTLLTPGGLRAREAVLEETFEEDHELFPLISEFLVLQRRLLRVYNGTENAIQSAIEDEDMGLLKELLRKGEDPNKDNAEGVPHLLAAFHRPAAVKALLDGGAVTNRLLTNKRMDWNKLPLLAAAASTGLVESTTMLIDAGATVDFTGSNGWTALMSGVGSGQHETVKLLLERGAKVNAKDIDGRFPLLEATLNDDLEMIDLLVDAGADLELSGTKNKLTALLLAGQQGKVATIKALADHGAKVDARDSESYTALMNASNRGLLENAEALIKVGADVNAKDAQGSTPVMFAAQHGHTAVVKKLLKSGAKPNLRGTHGFTALGLAKQYGSKHRETIRLLELEGAVE